MPAVPDPTIEKRSMTLAMKRIEREDLQSYDANRQGCVRMVAWPQKASRSSDSIPITAARRPEPYNRHD